MHIFRFKLPFAAVGLLTLAGCTAPAPATKAAAVADPNGPGPASTTSKHPLAKYIEFSGFRLTEAGPGKLKVQFAGINHSEADLGELVVKIRLVTFNAKPDEPPVTEFEAKIPSLGPLEVRNLEASAPTKLRVYELPDWQFLRAQFDITSPPPQ